MVTPPRMEQEALPALNRPLSSSLKEKCALLGPREAVRQTKASSGGVTKVESSAQMPRGERQAKYIRKTLTSSHQQ